MLKKPSIVVAAVAALLCLPAMASPKQSEKLADAIDVIRDFTSIPETAIPDSMLRNAYGIAIIPSTIKVGLMFGGNFGKGVLVTRLDDGSWSNPAFVRLGGGSFGWQIGAQSTDIIMVFKDRRSINNIYNDKLTLGAQASAAAGPVGRQTSASTDGKLTAEIYTYARNRGLFAGVSLGGAWFAMDRKANRQFYGSDIDPEQILSSGNLMAPQIAGEFVSVLTAAAPRIQMDQRIRSATSVQPAAGGTSEPLTPPKTYGLEPLESEPEALGMGGDETMF